MPALTSITVSIRQLHARTGHYLRKASKNLRVIVTDNGKPVVELKPLAPEANPKFPILPGGNCGLSSRDWRKQARSRLVPEIAILRI